MCETSLISMVNGAHDLVLVDSKDTNVCESIASGEVVLIFHLSRDPPDVHVCHHDTESESAKVGHSELDLSSHVCLESTYWSV